MHRGTIISGINTITYTDKTLNQFLNCSGIDFDITATDDIRSDDIIFGYENGDFTKPVNLRVAGIISDLKLDKRCRSCYYLMKKLQLKN